MIFMKLVALICGNQDMHGFGAMKGAYWVGVTGCFLSF